MRGPQLLTLLDGRLFNRDMGDGRHITSPSPPSERTLIGVDNRYVGERHKLFVIVKLMSHHILIAMYL